LQWLLELLELLSELQLLELLLSELDEEILWHGLQCLRSASLAATKVRRAARRNPRLTKSIGVKSVLLAPRPPPIIGQCLA
jgi:hypothetical protein